MRMRSLPEIANGFASSLRPKIVKSGRVSVRSFSMNASSSIRGMSASTRPQRHAGRCCAGGSRPATMEMKTMLSMPRTISSSVSVSRPIQPLGSCSHAIVVADSSFNRRRLSSAT